MDKRSLNDNDAPETVFDLPSPHQKKWTNAALDRWEAEVDKKIAEYLKTPCPYYGPDLDFPILRSGKSKVEKDF